MTEEDRRLKKDRVIDYLRRLPVYKWAAASVGVDQDTIKNWRDDDAEFSERCESARSEAVERLGKRASPDFMLAAIDGETFGKKDKVEHTGSLDIRWNDAGSNSLPPNASPVKTSPVNK